MHSPLGQSLTFEKIESALGFPTWSVFAMPAS